jgi:hypothetical protein
LQDLASLGPYASCFFDLIPDGLDVLVILDKDRPKITEGLYLLQNFPFNTKEMS